MVSPAGLARKTREIISAVIVCSSIFVYPLSSYAYDAKAQGNAAVMIISACTWSQMGKIPRSKIMSFARQQYSQKYGNPDRIDWNNAITVAQKLDKQQGLGCFR
jgi:hypothetical protein